MKSVLTLMLLFLGTVAFSRTFIYNTKLFSIDRKDGNGPTLVDGDIYVTYEFDLTNKLVKTTTRSSGENQYATLVLLEAKRMEGYENIMQFTLLNNKGEELMVFIDFEYSTIKILRHIGAGVFSTMVFDVLTHTETE